MMAVGKPFEDKPFRWSNFTELFNVNGKNAVFKIYHFLLYMV